MGRVPGAPAGGGPRPRLLDRALSESLVWLLLLTWVAGVVVAGLYAGGMTARRQSVPAWTVAVSAVVAVVTGIPVIRWLRPRVEALLFTHPEDAADLIADVGRRVARGTAAATGARVVAAEVADQVARRLRLPYAAILPPGGAPPDDAPPIERLLTVPLEFAGDAVGTLLVQPRRDGRGRSVDDTSLLAEIAVHVGIALHAAQVSDALRASRAALVAAREEERRRIRRDLHDGLGPTLASLRLHLAALEKLLPSRPDEGLALVTRLREEVRGTSAHVRGLVYDLRPPALDELGMVGALRARAADVDGPSVELDVPDDLPDLPASVEVALYRIAGEALSNVTRHAGAGTCRVSVRVTASQVLLTVEDDGRGLPDPLLPGVGLSAMRERAEEIAGTCVVGPGPEGRGTGVRVALPLLGGAG